MNYIRFFKELHDNITDFKPFTMHPCVHFTVKMSLAGYIYKSHITVLLVKFSWDYLQADNFKNNVLGKADVNSWRKQEIIFTLSPHSENL